MVKSHGAERLGKGRQRVYQVWINEMNESEPLKRCRESAYLLSKAVEVKTSTAETYLLEKGLGGKVKILIEV